MRKIILLFCQAALVTAAFSQNVGINISTATRAKLEVVGTAGGGATSGIIGSDGAGISIQQNWPTIGFNQYRDDVTPGSQGKYMANGYAAIQYFDPGSGNIVIDMFASGVKGNSTPPSTLGMIITSNGRVGIRSGVLDATLTVGRGDGTDGTAAFRGLDLPSHFNYSVTEDTYIRGGTAPSNVYFNNIPAGDVVMGTASTRLGINTAGAQPTTTVEIRQPTVTQSFSLTDNFNYTWGQRVEYSSTANNGSGGSYLWFIYAGAGRGRIRFWDGLYESASDRRLKTNFAPMEPVLEKINQLKPVRYEMKNNNENHDEFLGFIAQDVKPVFPLLVRQMNNERNEKSMPGMLTMNYSGFGVLAIKALQEQYAQIMELEKELDASLAALEKLVGKR